MAENIYLSPSYARNLEKLAFFAKRAARSRIIVRPATRDDLRVFAGSPNDWTVTALCGEVDGRIVGVGGFAHVRGTLVAFCDLTDEARAYRVALVKAGRRLVGEMGRLGRPIYAQIDINERGAVRWLTSLGFRPVEGIGDTWKWQPES